MIKKDDANTKIVSVDQVSPEALVTNTREIRAKTEKQLEPHKTLCDEWKVVFFSALQILLLLEWMSFCLS